MADLKEIGIDNESLNGNIFVLTQSILIQEWQQTASQTFNFTDSLFILVMCIPFLHISGPRDFIKHISGKMSLSWKELIAQKSLLHGKIKKMISRAHVRSLEQKARNAHDQSV